MRNAVWAVGFVVWATVSPLSAQAAPHTTSRTPACRVDSFSVWFRRQRAWLDESKATSTNDSLRQVLVGALGGDRSELHRPQLGVELLENNGMTLGPSDSVAVASLTALARQRGAAWPTRSVVGAVGVRAVWLLAMRDTALQRAALHRLMEAGPDESFPPDVAMLEDRLRVRDGRGQLYATQFRWNGSAVAPLRTEDLAHVDLRREGAMLPPLKLSLCEARRRERLAR